MFGIGKMFKTIILIVLFVALACIASYFYNSDQAKQTEIKNNSLFQKGKEIFNVVLGVSGEVANENAKKNLGFGNKIVEKAGIFVKNTDWQGIVDGTKTDEVGDTDEAKNTEIDFKNIAAEATEIVDFIAPTNSMDKENSGFFSKMTTKLKEEWEKIKEEEANNSDNSDFDVETIFNIKTGEENAVVETE